MQTGNNKRRNKYILYCYLIISLFSTDVLAYPGCCYASREYHNEWKAIGKYMKKFYTDAAKITKKTQQANTDAIPFLLFRSRDLITSIGYAQIFDASKGVSKKIIKQYSSLYMTTTGPIVFDALLAGKDVMSVLSHPPRIEKGLMDFVNRSHTGSKSKNRLIGNQHLSKREIVYVKKEIKQTCMNDELAIKNLEAEVFMLELALSKLSVLSNDVIKKDKKKLKD